MLVRARNGRINELRKCSEVSKKKKKKGKKRKTRLVNLGCIDKRWLASSPRLNLEGMGGVD